jgi:hypothetical protein
LPASTSPSPTRSPSTAARLAQIAERAQTLAERLETALAERLEGALTERLEDAFSERLERARVEPAPAVEFKPDLLAGWARAFSAGDLAALERRLSWDGLDLALAAKAVASGSRSPAASLPPWLDLATRRFSLGDDRRPEARGTRARITGLDLAAVPFGELWAPVVEAALTEAAHEIDRIDAGVLPRRDLATLAGALAADIGAVGARAAHERYLRFRRSPEGDGAPGAYGRFIESELASGLLDFALEFPVALRQIALLVDTWIAALVELAGRIGRDRPALAERFAAGRDPGAVESVSQLPSDRHDGGRGIFRVRFAGGIDLVIKPRSLAIEVAWERLLARLAALGFAELPPAARALDCGTHGWMEWIGAEELADRESAEEWFRRAGALVALAELLGAEDLHAENLIAVRGGPVVIDAEMMAQPDRPGTDTRQRFAGGLLRRAGGGGVGAIGGIGGIGGIGRRDRIGNWAGLHPVLPRTVTAQAEIWRDLGGDGITPVAGEIVTSSLPNAPRLAGRQLDPTDHAAALSLGHRRTWERLLARREELLTEGGPLAELAGVSTRLLFRPSQEYATVLDRLKAPRYQREGTTAGILLEALARPFATAERAPLAWPLVGVERAMLEALDVPRFAVGADQLVVESSGKSAGGLIRRTTRAAIASRLGDLSAAEIDRRADELASALAASAGPRISLAPAEGSGDRTRAGDRRPPDGIRARADSPGRARGRARSAAACASWPSTTESSAGRSCWRWPTGSTAATATPPPLRVSRPRCNISRTTPLLPTSRSAASRGADPSSGAWWRSPRCAARTRPRCSRARAALAKASGVRALLPRRYTISSAARPAPSSPCSRSPKRPARRSGEAGRRSSAIT